MGTLKCLTTGHDWDPVTGRCRRLGCGRRKAWEDERGELVHLAVPANDHEKPEDDDDSHD